MPLVVTALAPGFAGHDTLQLAVTDARLMLPYLAFAGPATVLLALASAQGRFFVTAFSPLLFNLALIAVMIALIVARAGRRLCRAGAGGHRRHRRPAAACSCWRSAAARAIATPLRVSFDAEMRGFFARAIPGMIASAGPQLLAIAGAIIASSSPSAVSWLYFANRLIELPLGMVGVAMGTVLIPELTRALHGGDKAAIAHAESRALELAAGLALPAMLGLIVLSAPIVRLLFEHGAFTAADTASTAQALIWLALGLPAHVAGEDAVAGLLRARGYLDAAAGDPEGIRVRDRARAAARPLPRRRRHRHRSRLRRLEHGVLADPRRARPASASRSTPMRDGGCRASSRRRW